MLAHSDVVASIDNTDNADKINQLKSEFSNTSLDELAVITVEAIQTHLSRIKTLAALVHDTIAALPDEKISFATVIQPLIDLDIFTQTAKTVCTFPMHVHLDKAVREASADASEELEKLNIECSQREDVFNVFHQYILNVHATEMAKLHGEELRYVDDMMTEYKRNGLYIQDAETKERIKQIKNDLSELCTQFEHNLSENDTSFVMTKDELKGLPEDWFTAEREIAPGQYKVTLKYPDVFPILDNVSYRPTREKIYTAFDARCEQENLPILKRVLELRAELASLLGYATHADYVAETRMAKDAKTIKSFLDDMNTRFTPLLDKTLQELTEFARKKENDPDFTLQQYDMRYYKRLREEALCNIDMNEIKKYFGTEKVIDGTLAIYAHLLGLAFVKNEDRSIWHNDVKSFDVFDKQTGERLGYFNLDLHPRDGKYSHAAVMSHLNGCDISHLTGTPGERMPNVAAMVCNFPKNGNITFDDATTFFHEFGHVMHFMCSKTKLAEYHSDHTETDFVEAPSQMLENWCFEPSALSILSAHPETNEPLPQSIAMKMKDKDKMHAGYFYKRQLVFGYFDFLIHNMTLDEVKTLDIKTFFQNLQHEIMQLPLMPDNCFPASFGHLIGGYDVGYYGYMMSETYAADMFATIFKNDPLSAESGMKYRRCILEPGSSQDGDVLLHNFLGRAPTLDAFLEACGLTTATLKRTNVREKVDSDSKEERPSKLRKLSLFNGIPVKETSPEFTPNYSGPTL